jgi:hypothetical protein
MKGFHFCRKIENLNEYYAIRDSRIFEIKASGKIVKGSEKCAAKKIKLVKELPKEEINNYFRLKQKMLVKSWDQQIRGEVASQGYCLDMLIHDEWWQVRAAVAKQGYGLEELICDEDLDVRTAGSRTGFCLDMLVNDENKYVRRTAREMKQLF